MLGLGNSGGIGLDLELSLGRSSEGEARTAMGLSTATRLVWRWRQVGGGVARWRGGGDNGGGLEKAHARAQGWRRGCVGAGIRDGEGSEETAEMSRRQRR